MSDQNPAPFNADQDRQWAAYAHFGGIVVILGLLSSWATVLAIVPALVIFVVNGKRGSRTREEAREALNFQITMVGAIIIWSVLAAILGSVFFSITQGGVGWVVINAIFGLIGLALVLVDLVFSIIAGSRVNSGGSYRYPFALRLVK